MIGSLLRFSLDDKGMVPLDSTCIATGVDVPYITAILNTTMGNYLFSNAPKTGTGDLIVSVQAMNPILVPKPTAEQKQFVENLLYEIINHINNNVDYHSIEARLEDYVYSLYGINTEERAFIEDYVTRNYR